MKSYTITCHDVYNYGASLQAYSLQRYLASRGIDNEIIDYKPDYLSHHFSLWGCSHPLYKKPLLSQLYSIYNLPRRVSSLKKKRLFDLFTKNYLVLTPETYQSNEALKNANLSADIYIAGSDQIWNTLFKNGHDPAFYLDFVDKGLKISYAASFATAKIFDDPEKKINNYLQRFDAISVREKSALKILDELGVSKYKLVVDPVFLLDKTKWLKLIESVPKNKKEYILLYDCERSNELREIAIFTARKLKMPIYCIGCTSRKKYWHKDLRNSGPLEFLRYVRDAHFVITNSFHATAFSVIFQKNFFICNRTSGINSRLKDFLDIIGLSDRLISKPEDIIFKSINFSLPNNKIKKLIEESAAFITHNFK